MGFVIENFPGHIKAELSGRADELLIYNFAKSLAKLNEGVSPSVWSEWQKNDAIAVF
jgi:hypothetical protein